MIAYAFRCSPVSLRGMTIAEAMAAMDLLVEIRERMEGLS